MDGLVTTNRERENATLGFKKPSDRGSVEETFFPWDLTISKWREEGFPSYIADNIAYNNKNGLIPPEEAYLYCEMAQGIYDYEQFLGYDGVKRLFFILPFLNFETKMIEETDEYVVRQEYDGWQRKYHKNRDLVEDYRPVVNSEADWYLLKERAGLEIQKYYTDENIQRIYGKYREGHNKGDFSIRLAIAGFFWTPRELLGIERHLLAFYDYPELLHDMNEFILSIYFDRLDKVLDIVPADVLYIMEDLSGANGPMISPGLYDEFIGAYYKRLVPFLKQKGVKHVMVDTDGDFNVLIPKFIESGIEGFLPMDVNAGMDIVAVRQRYPKLKFIGGFNKLKIAAGKEAIDDEFERLMPVIRQGGYIPACDHQVPPSAYYENYRYYIKRLKEVMKVAGEEALSC